MTFSEALIYATGLLCLERRVTYRRLRKELSVDPELLDDVCHELIVARRFAVDEGGEVLVWADAPGKDTRESTGPGPARVGTTARSSTSQSSADTPRPDAREVHPTEPASEHDAPEHAPVDAERRQLTVVFCDLVGSTELSSRLDPEDLRELIVAYQDLCRGAVQRYDGFIARYMGDGILIYFGYPRAHEQDAERAVRASLDIVDSMEALNAETGRHYGVVLAVRIGVATGPVVVGDIVGDGASEERAVVGETPNLAARLQGIASPGQVVIASATRDLAGERFEYSDLGEQRLKGVAGPVHVWRVEDVAEPASRVFEGPARQRLPIVGRQEELGLLLRGWEAARDGHGCAVLVSGEAGIGKSRLLAALAESVADRDCTRISLRSSPYHTSTALHPVIDHLKRFLRWNECAHGSARLKRLEQALARSSSLSIAETLPLFASLLSLPLPQGRDRIIADRAPQQIRQDTQDALVAWMLEETEQRPVIAIWEDLHWADASTVELLGLLLEQAPTSRMLVVGTYRPDFAPPWPSRSHVTPISLNRLEQAEVTVIVDNLAGGKALPEPVVGHIVDKSDGVPLFVEELGKAVLSSALLEELPDRFRLKGTLAEMDIPETLQDSLMARLDRLPLAREVAQVGAVVGREFEFALLRHFGRWDETTLRDVLGQLVDSELLYQRGRPPRSRYMFKHALIQDAAYQSLLKRKRQEHHARVAELLETRFADVSDSQPELLARHFLAAANGDKGLEYLEQAGRKAADGAANVEALEHFGRAVELLGDMPGNPERDRQKLRLQTSLAQTLSVTLGYAHPDVGEAFRQARDMCGQDDIPTYLKVVRGLWIFTFVRGELQAARDIGEECFRLAERIDDDDLPLEGHHMVGEVHFSLGEFEESQRHLESAVALYERAGRRDDYLHGAVVGVLPMCFTAHNLWQLGYPDRALARIENALALARKLAHPFGLALAFCYGAMLHQFRRDSQRALRLAEKAIEVCAERRYEYYLAWGRIIQRWAMVEQGGGPEHVARMREGLADLMATGARLRLPYYLVTIAESSGNVGQIAEGRAALEEARIAMEKNGECWQEAERHRIHGDLTLMGSDAATREAEADFLQAIDVARKQGAKCLEVRAAVSLGRLWRRQGKDVEAQAMLRAIVDGFEEGLDTADLKDARTLLR